ncbi:MAG: DUF3383 domain-containing protein [Colwellia sp.]|nr:DUF3383 domain-containing protein [Colwellia sp.]
MATFIPWTVRTVVTLEGRQTTSTGFSTPLFLAVHNIGTERQFAVSSTQELLDKGFATGSPAVKFAQGVFAGAQKPSMLRIGRVVPTAYTVQVDTTATEGDVVSVYMNLTGTESSFAYTLVTGDDTGQEIGDGLAALIQADAGITSATSDANGLITIVPVSATDAITFGIDQNTTVYTTAVESIPTVMSAVRAESEDYAILCSEQHDTTTLDALSTYNEANDSLAVYSSQDPNALIEANSTDVFSVLKAKEFRFTGGMYYSNADRDFPEGALVGTFAGQDPSYKFTTNLQSLVGVATDTLTDGQKSALAGKNASWYAQGNGVGNFYEGYTPSGDYIDRVRFALWLKIRGQESLFNTLKRKADRSSGLGYNDTDIAIAEANLRTDVVNKGIRNGTILTGVGIDDQGYTIDYNPVIDTNTRANQTNAAISQRLWEGFTLEVVYNSCIHHLDAKFYVENNRTAV